MEYPQFFLRDLIENHPDLAFISGILHSKIVPVGLGILTHLATNHREWDHYGHIIFPGGCALLIALAVIEYVAGPCAKSILQAAEAVGTAAIGYFATLLTSVAIYRAWFHRLRKVCLD